MDLYAVTAAYVRQRGMLAVVSDDRRNSIPPVCPRGPMDASFGYTFPSISGVQAQRQYYISMCPLRLIPKIFLFDEEELVPELRAQRSLNKARLPEMSQYIL